MITDCKEYPTYEDDQPSVLASLVFGDAWIDILSNLKMEEIAFTRRVCSYWYTEGKQRVILYRIGLSKDGWYQWHNQKSPTNGWGMKISVDSRGLIRGANRNDGEDRSMTKNKVYNGILVKDLLKISVFFPETDQENEYEGTIVKEEDKLLFKGSYVLTRSCGQRSVGETGKMEGFVLQA